MAHPDPRQQVLHNLQQVLRGRSLDQVLLAPTRLSARDQALVAELSYGLCRWYRQLEALVARYLRKPLRGKDQAVQHILLLGVYQLLYSRVPDHAVLATSVALTRRLARSWAAGLVNGVLRQVQRELQAGTNLIANIPPGERYAQPDWLLAQIQAAWPQDWSAMLEALQQRAPMTLRLNLRRQNLADYLVTLQAAGMAGAAVAAVPGAVVLQQPTVVEQIPGFATGVVSVQDAGAQLAAQLLDVQPGQRILDACAAPGGKTGHILELTDVVDLVAVDQQADRLVRVTENLQRLQLAAQCEALDASQPPAAWREQPFDRILLDVPCSATGVMRRHPDIRLLRWADDIPALVQRQAALLRAMWPCLQVGGKLLYATCSVLPAENQDQIAAFVQQQPDAQLVPLNLDCGRACVAGWQIFPGEQAMDGFYYALLTKRHP
jgi:16S rRNA (cytosine967-C5)-methyltransferase